MKTHKATGPTLEAGIFVCSTCGDQAYLGKDMRAHHRPKSKQKRLKITKNPTIQEIHRRTPMITIELQLWPQPPPKGKVAPYWWGLHRLTFYEIDERGRYVLAEDGRSYKHVWDREFPELDYEWAGGREGLGPGMKPRIPSASLGEIRFDDRFGWVLIMEVLHDRARFILEKLGLAEIPGVEERKP